MPQREQMLLPYLAVYIHDLSEYPQVCRYQIYNPTHGNYRSFRNI